MGPGAKEENIKQKPTLKWREVESTLGKRDSSELVDKSLPPADHAAPRPRFVSSDPEPGGGVQACAVTSTNAGLDDGNAWLDEPRQLDPNAVGVKRRTFTLGGRVDIDLSSPYLRDILSDTNVSQMHAYDTPDAPKNNPRGGDAATNPPPASTE
ncbi:hypothetical protein BS17DRAFT_785301 [Gyrodon lividus]|nr:hypothetical protein BS17DRAFT_785301 [Gyrodon lividus]